ncbi:MAG: transposon-encoded TnpW family protein [Clostridia bacterium]|nr:transposon-encoded TnpW family protein [Clostridia bacterium]
MNLTKRIGRTTYKINVHFNENAKETFEQKFLRVISDYPLASGEKCGIINTSQMSRSA